MENKEPVSEFASTANEWKNLSTKTFHQVNKSLGTKGRIAIIFGIAIIWLLGSVLAHMGDRYDRSFDRDYGNMRQGRESMMGISRRGDDQFQGRNLRGLKGNQGCSQQATLEIDPSNPNTQVVTSQVNCPFADQSNSIDDTQKSDGFFDRMESRMQQLFGSDNKGDTQSSQILKIPVSNTGSNQ